MSIYHEPILWYYKCHLARTTLHSSILGETKAEARERFEVFLNIYHNHIVLDDNLLSIGNMRGCYPDTRHQ